MRGFAFFVVVLLAWFAGVTVQEMKWHYKYSVVFGLVALVVGSIGLVASLCSMTVETRFLDRNEVRNSEVGVSRAWFCEGQTPLGRSTVMVSRTRVMTRIC